MSDIVIREAGKWTLAYYNGNLEARKPMPHDGNLRYTTEQRADSYGKNSRYNLTRREVVRHFVLNTNAEESIPEILDDA